MAHNRIPVFLTLKLAKATPTALKPQCKKDNTDDGLKLFQQEIYLFVHFSSKLHRSIAIYLQCVSASKDSKNYVGSCMHLSSVFRRFT